MLQIGVFATSRKCKNRKMPDSKTSSMNLGSNSMASAVEQVMTLQKAADMAYEVSKPYYDQYMKYKHEWKSIEEESDEPHSKSDKDDNDEKKQSESHSLASKVKYDKNA